MPHLQANVDVASAYTVHAYTRESIPKFLHNKPTFHNWHTILILYIIDRLWKAGLLCKYGRKYPAV